MSARPLWIGALALTLAVVALDSASRLRAIEAVTDTRVGAGLQPAVDRDSPSGYRWGAHRLVLPETDSYLWLLQAEESVASGAFRVREARFDNAPVGREVHWAGFQRWWALGLAALHHLAHPDLTAAQSLERVAPWANTALLVVFLLSFTPIVAARLGAVPAAMLCLGSFAVFPFYEYLRVGYLDHHGPAILASLACVLLLIVGGSGWVRADEPPDARAARRWFIASGVAGGVGLWISAATMAPVLVGIGLAGLVVGVSAHGPTPRAAKQRVATRLEPSLFRAWGLAGAVSSCALYLLEYFPDHLGMRLEVNHPLYALALLGGGDLIARLLSRVPDDKPSTMLWIGADLAAMLALPAVVLATGTATFRLSDPVLWTLHNRYINEFLDLGTVVLAFSPTQMVGRLSLVVLVALPIATLLWSNPLAGGWRIAWRALVVALVGAAAAYAYVFFLGLAGGNRVAGVVGAGAAVGLCFLLPVSRRPTALAPPGQAALVLVSVPALVMLLLALAQERWLGSAAALWLGALVVTPAVLASGELAFARTALSRALAGALTLLVLVIAPLFALREPYSPPNSAVIARDASLWLRRRLGAEQGVVFAGPSATASMIWFGGFRGLGTLYWENLEGLRASAEICSAPDAASARALLARHGVTHVAAYGWDGGLEQLQLSVAAAPSAAGWPRLPGREIQGMCLHDPRELPPWLVPLPYVPPRVAGYEHPVVRLFEVVDDLAPEVALVRLARYYQALQDPRTQEALARSLELGPSVGGLAMAAQLQSARGDRPGLTTTAERLRVELARPGRVDPQDRIEAAIALALARDGPAAARELGVALREADEGVLRRLTPERLALVVDLGRQLGLDRDPATRLTLAAALLQEG